MLLLYVWCSLPLISIAIHMCSNQNLSRPRRKLEKSSSCPCFQNNPSMLSKSLHFLLFCHVEMKDLNCNYHVASVHPCELFSFINTIGPFIRGKIRRELYHLYTSMPYLIRRVLAKPRLVLDKMCRLYGKFASYLRRVLCKTRLIFPRINGSNVLTALAISL